jgi:hypothetical protein
MINFSKEELDELRLCVAAYQDKFGEPYYRELYEKLTDLIENYNKVIIGHIRVSKGE